MLQVKTTDRGRPSVNCKLSEDGCGFTGFVNAGKGVAMWAGDGKPAAATAAPPAAAPKEKPAPAAAGKSEKGGFKFPWQE